MYTPIITHICAQLCPTIRIFPKVTFGYSLRSHFLSVLPTALRDFVPYHTPSWPDLAISPVVKKKQASCCCCWVASVVSNSVRPRRRQPTRLPHPWDSPGKNTGVDCHFLLQCMKVKGKLLSHVWLFATPWTAAQFPYPSSPKNILTLV